YLLYKLQAQLYDDFYLSGRAIARRWHTRTSISDMRSFVARLSAANASRGYWDTGWELRAVTESQVIVQKSGLELWVRPEDCSIGDDRPMAPGTLLGLRFPKEFLSMS